MSKYISAATGSPSGLTDAERSLLLRLAIASVVENYGCTDQDAADVLDKLAARGKMHIIGDQARSNVVAAMDGGDLVLVSADRSALRIVAHPSGSLDN